jgi:hypothetical protein
MSERSRYNTALAVLAISYLLMIAGFLMGLLNYFPLYAVFAFIGGILLLGVACGLNPYGGTA